MINFIKGVVNALKRLIFTPTKSQKSAFGGFLIDAALASFAGAIGYAAATPLTWNTILDCTVLLVFGVISLIIGIILKE